MSGALGAGLIQLLILNAVGMWVQLRVGRMFAYAEMLIALSGGALCVLNYRTVQSKRFRLDAEKFDMLSRTQRWSLLLLVVLVSFVISILSVRYIGTYQKFFHIGIYSYGSAAE
jgi:hypothetical protein